LIPGIWKIWSVQLIKHELRVDGHHLVSKRGRRYPVVEGLPVLLVPDEVQTIGIAHASIERAQGRFDGIDGRAPELYLESLGYIRVG
jgi:hypothetical protein